MNDSLRFTWRDRLVCVVCNWLLNHVASERYRAMIGGSIQYGLRAAANDGWTETDWEIAYAEAMQWRDWQTCDILIEERERQSWWPAAREALGA